MKSFYWVLSALSLSLGQAAGYLVSPAGTAAPGSNEDCSLWYRYVNGSDCEAVEVLYEITATEFEEWVINRHSISFIFTNAYLPRIRS